MVIRLDWNGSLTWKLLRSWGRGVEDIERNWGHWNDCWQVETEASRSDLNLPNDTVTGFANDRPRGRASLSAEVSRE